MSEYSLKFDTPEQRKQAVEDLVNMKESTRGWFIVREVLKQAIEGTKKEILSPPEGMNEDTVNRLRVRLKVQETVYNLPDMLIEDWTRKSFTNIPNIDPYDYDVDLVPVV